MLGTKIIIVGVSASGKSTFARKLAALSNIPLIFVDELFWKTGWQYIGDDAAMKIISHESSHSSWIIEGYVNDSIKKILLDRADTIIFLNYSRLRILFHYLKRWWIHRHNPRPELNGNTERLRFKMIRRIWSEQENKSLRALLNQLPYSRKVVILTTPKEASQFLKRLSR
jgi:adenylate kinase family enzyme